MTASVKANEPIKLGCGHIVKFSQSQIDSGRLELRYCAGCTPMIPEDIPSKKYFEENMGWETKDSGERIDYPSGMRRDIQSGKPRFDLLTVDDQPYNEQFITRIASLLARGAEKYGERNWQLADSPEELSRFRASGLRHMFQYMAGESDEDHAAAVVFNLMAAEYVKWKLENAQVTEAPKLECLVHSGCGGKGECAYGVSRVGQESNSSAQWVV